MRDPNRLFKLAFDAQIEGDHNKAEKLYRRLLKMNPEWEAKKTITYNLGLVLMSLQKYADAIKFFNKSNSLKRTDENSWCKCLCLLNLGKWDKAMQLFHHRYGETRHSDTAVAFPKLPIPQVRHVKDLKPTKMDMGLPHVLVLNEQGLGDEILFSTQLKKLDKLVARALVQVSKENLDLFNEIYHFDSIEFSDFETISVEDVKIYDYCIALGDVFASLYEIGEDVVGEIRYESPDNNVTGICWATNRKSPNSDKRSIDPSVFKSLSYEISSLQYGEGYGKTVGLDDYLPENTLETWNKLDALDFVITVDTMIAHLAGLKGIPTFLIINKHLDWRWRYRLEDDNDFSMFYPDVEIINVDDDLNEILDSIM